ncbi:ADP-ribosylglycohydrolase [Microcella alkaliphila]|uniref:ADP-ribosylglycohydrolase n=1 Tax=Microcella alkaliphila TaxID=279828 RepID=A0A4Q7TM10_9MICO|nr:ADP-ribosylglycohydrolase family protein [Microcella alkaliphila]RZT60688.1 ADP-ribosylglycohydrolase [Microcella alkaliphila]
MHDVLDLRDLVVDEAEQRILSGFEIADVAVHALAAARDNDTAAMEVLYARLDASIRSDSWSFDEPEAEASLTSLSDRSPRLPVDVSRLPDKLRGAWTGRAVGNTIGKPIEGLNRTEVGIYLRAAEQWPVRGYLPLVDPLPAGVSVLHPSAPVSTVGSFDAAPRDDDIDWTIVALHVMEKYGRHFDTADVAREWLDRVPFTQTYTAERAAYRNLIHGLAAPLTATYRNPYREWIGALIRGDAFGYVNPGDPGAAAQLALKDARLSHTGNGIYGELWAAALTAAALAEADMAEAFESSLSVIPPGSRLAVALRSIAKLHLEGRSWAEALDWIDAELGQYPWVHTINNAAQIAAALLWGSSFLDALHITVAGGRDTDSNGATVGSVWGALHGIESIPAELVGSTHTRVRSAVRDFDRVAIEDLVARTLALIDA